MDDHVAPRPVREDDLPMVETLIHDPDKTGESGWSGWIDPRRWRRSRDESRLLSDDGGILVVVKGGEMARAGQLAAPAPPRPGTASRLASPCCRRPAAAGVAPGRACCWPATCSRTPPCTEPASAQRDAFELLGIPIPPR